MIQPPDFSKYADGLVPVIAQDSKTRKVLMLGFMNEEAFKKTIEENKACFYSRSRKTLWTKGETSGNILDIVEIKQDCDNDTLLILVDPAGPVCHRGSDTCFGEKNDTWDLHSLEAIIAERKIFPRQESYTTTLLSGPLNKVAQKVGEEAVELVIEAVGNDDKKFLDEAADLLYHYLVLLHAKGFEAEDVIRVLKTRNSSK